MLLAFSPFRMKKMRMTRIWPQMTSRRVAPKTRAPKRALAKKRSTRTPSSSSMSSPHGALISRSSSRRKRSSLRSRSLNKRRIYWRCPKMKSTNSRTRSLGITKSSLLPLQPPRSCSLPPCSVSSPRSSNRQPPKSQVSLTTSLITLKPPLILLWCLSYS
jgi:hypothetical protein